MGDGREANLLDQVEKDVISDRPLADALRKCVILGGQAGSVELRDWATRELRGYEPDDEVPAYRTVVSNIYVDAFTGGAIVTGQQIGASMLPSEVREHIGERYTFLNGVGEIEAFAQQGEASGGMLKIGLPGGVEIAHLMDAASNNPYQHITRMYWNISVASLRGIVDQVRTTLAELVAEMRAGMSASVEVPSKDVVNQALNVAVHGNRARVVVTNAQSSEGNAAVTNAPRVEEHGFWTHGRRVGAFFVGAGVIVTAVVAVIQWSHG